MLALLLTAVVLAGEGLVLPEGEDPAAWSRAFAETALEPAVEGPARIEAGDGGWRLVVVDGAGITHIARITPPATEEDRLDLAYLVLSLLEPAGEGTWRRALAPSTPPPAAADTAPVVPAPAEPMSAVVVEVSDPGPESEPQPAAPEPERDPEPVARVAPLPVPESAARDTPGPPSAPGPGVWLSLLLGSGYWPGWNDRLQGRVEGGFQVAERWRVGAGAQLSGPLVLDEARQGTERGGHLVVAWQLAPVWFSLGAALTDRTFTLHGEVVDRALVPSLEAGVRLGFLGPLGLSASPLFQVRRDLRTLEVRIGSEPDGALPPWDLQIGLVVSWSSARDQVRGAGDT